MLLKAYLNPLTYQRTALLSHLQSMAVVGLLLAGFFAFFRALIRPASITLLLGCALVSTALYLNGFDQVGAALYWFSGYTAYTAGIIASLFAFAGMLTLHRSPARFTAQLGGGLVACFFSVVTVGTYDICMMAILWMAFSAVAAGWWFRHPARWWFTVQLLLVVIGVYFSVTAPGNQERALNAGRNLSQLIKSPQVVVLLAKSVFFALTQCVTWINSLLLLLGTLLIVGLLSRVPLSMPAGVKRPPLTLLAVWLLAGISSMILPSILVYQSVWSHSWQCVYFYFLLGWGWLMLLIVNYCNARLAWLPDLSSSRVWQVLVLLFSGICVLGGHSNTHLAYLDVATSAPKYYARVRQREQLVKAQASHHQSVLDLQPLYTYDDTWMLPKDLYTVGFSVADAQQFAHYYGIDSVVVRPQPYHP